MFHELTWPVDHHIMGFLEEKPWHPTESIIVSFTRGWRESDISSEKKKRKSQSPNSVLSE